MFGIFGPKKPKECTIYVVDFVRKRLVAKETFTTDTDKNPLTEEKVDIVKRMGLMYNRRNK